MSSGELNKTELLALCGEVRDQSITPERLARLDHLLSTDDRACRFFLEFIRLTTLLETEGRQQSINDFSDPEDSMALLLELLEVERRADVIPVDFSNAQESNDAGSRLSFGSFSTAGGFGRSGGLRWVAYAAAVLFLGMLATIVLLTGESDDAQPIAEVVDQPWPSDASSALKRMVATLADEANASWAGAAPTVGDTLLANQPIFLTEGFATLRFQNQAEVVLQAPCEVVPISETAVRIKHGRIIGICETDASKGFVVRTNHADIVDLGTRFGVAVDQAGQAVVRVFEGQVQVKLPRAAKRGDSKLLGEGDALAIDASGELIADEPAADQFAKALAHAHGLQLTGDIKWASSAAYTGDDLAWPKRDHAVVFEEMRGVTLAQDAKVTLNQPGKYDTFSGTPAKQVIPKGTKVRSYLVVLNPDSQLGTTAAVGSIGFQGDILGVIASNNHDAAFRRSLAKTAPPLVEFASDGAWVESKQPDKKEDKLILHDDGQTLSFEMGTLNLIDVFRVIVQEP